MNQEQKQAVEYNQGPLLIIAGAGTGKTSVIVEKVKYLISQKLAKPEEILALTFTDKAANEMQERIDQALPYGYFQMWITTFHSFADQILKEEAPAIGITPAFKLMNQAETIIFLKKNLFLFNLRYFQPLGNPHKFLEALLQHFSRLRDEDISPDDYLQWAKSQNSPSKTNQKKRVKVRKTEEKIEIEKYLELAQAYQTYQTLKIKNGVFDFADLVFYLVKLFRQRPNILKKYQHQFRYVLIDEFQDTNIVQYQLIKLLCPYKNNPKLTVVGDDSQSIYKFRGASVSNILTFMSDYPKAKQITLRKNYRSPQTILNAAYKLIRHNDPDTLEAKLGISKNLIAQKKDVKGAIKFYLAQTVEEEAEFVCKQIIRLKKFFKFSDFAILARANNHIEPFIHQLIRKGIPYQFLGPGMLFKQSEVKDLIAYLKVLYNPEDSVSLFRVLSMDIFSIDSLDLILLLSTSRKINLSLFQTIEVYLSFFYKEFYQGEFEIYKMYLPFLKKETREKLREIYLMIRRHLRLVKKEAAGQILYYFLEDSKYLNKLVSYKTAKDEKIALNISKFFQKLKTFETEHEDASVFAVVDYLEMSIELGESPLVAQTDIETYNAVNLLTVHSAKGLEFPVVFLVNLTAGRFPTYQRKEAIPIPDELIKEILPVGDYHQQEERRLFYVGLTRAMNKVYLTASRFYGEGKREQKISSFVIEVLGENFVKRNLRLKQEKKTPVSILNFKKDKPKILIKKNELINFSYTQLETYQRCPLQYKYQFILKIPTLPSAAVSFGETIHKTLYKFYKEFIHKKRIDKKKLLEIYRKQWIPVGYTSAAHERRMKKEGEIMLINFFKKFHHPDLKIIDLERIFKIKIDNEIFIRGKIDRIDAKEKGEIEIIDYKTGKLPDENELKKNLQMSIYALAANSKTLYNKKLDKIILSFYYLTDSKKISLKKTFTEIEKVKTKVKEIVSEIHQNKFLPNVGPWCDFCPFKIICEAWQ